MVGWDGRIGSAGIRGEIVRFPSGLRKHIPPSARQVLRYNVSFHPKWTGLVRPLTGCGPMPGW